jgi:hypothetical protein
MRLNPALLPALPPPATPHTASLTLSSPLPPGAQPTTLTVLRPAAAPGQPSTMQLPDGSTIEAILAPSLPAGAKVSMLPTAAAMPAPTGTATNDVITPTTTPRIVTVSLPSTPRNAASSVAATPVTPALASSTPAPQALPTIALQLQPAATPPTSALPPGPLPLPANGLAAVLQALARAQPGQPLPITLVPSNAPASGTSATGTFAAQLQGLTTLPGQPAPTLALPAPLAGPTPGWIVGPNPSGNAAASPVLLLGTAVNQASLPANSPQTALPALPFTITSATPLPQGQTMLARVVSHVAPPPGGNAPGTTVPILLANGQTAALVPVNLSQPAPTPLPAAAGNGTLALTHAAGTRPVPVNAYLQPGSTLMVEFPAITGAPRVQGVQAVAPQAQNAQNQPQLPGGTTPAVTPTSLPAAQTILPTGTVVSGTITGQTPQGQPILTLSAAPLIPTNTRQPAQPLPPGSQVALDLPEPLPLGSKLTLQLGAAGQPAALLALELPAASQRAHTLSQLGTQWPGLQHALQALQSASPAAAQTLLQRLPQLANLLPGLLGMLASLRQAKESATDPALTESLGPLLKALGVDLTPDLTALQQLTQRQEDTPWRGLVFPYQEHPGDQPRQGGFFWRREGEDEDPRSPTATRFVVELSLSQQGPVQLDGLLTYPALWLKLRQTVPASTAYVQGLQSVVANALSAHGLNGGIAVDVLAANTGFPVNPRAELLSDGVTHLPRSI